MTTALKLWEWAESCDPENVTEDNVWRLFGLLNYPEGCIAVTETQKCRRVALCKANPYCLESVTPSLLYKSIKESKKELDKLREIDEAQKSDSEYVGLDNLGATCYVNSYIQMWFHTAPFRHLILRYQPAAASENEQGHDDSIEATIHQMRVLFGNMLLTKKRSILPDAFIETLGLDPSNQQDAQEFSNLWMGLLQHRFGTSFSRLFCGSCEVSTTCDACQRPSRKPDEFTELILNVPAAEAMPQNQIVESSPGRRQGGTTVNLEDVMRRYFGDEILDGDNAYECNFRSCGKKGKAVRRTRLEKAPAILNAQVLRFAFDPVKLTRRKLRTLISFPEHLELRREFFAEDSPELKQSSLPRYRIKAILCHIGTSVVRGHYTARIRLRDGWYIFNDAVVKKGDPTSGGDGGVDADENGAGGRRFRSADAYCIVYHRVDAPELIEDDDDLLSDVNIIPEDLRREVDEVEAKFRKEIDDKKNMLSQNTEKKEACREQRLRIRQEMEVRLTSVDHFESVNQVRAFLDDQSGGGVVFLSKDFLADFLSLKAADEMKQKKEFGLGDGGLCDHGRLNPTMAGSLKVITRSAAISISKELGYSESAPVFSPDDMCITCVRLICFEHYFHCCAQVLARDLKVELKQIDNNVGGDRPNWIVREFVERFGDLAKEAVDDAASHLRAHLKDLAKETPPDAAAVKSLPVPVETNPSHQFFGTAPPSFNGKTTKTTTGVRDIPPGIVILNDGKKTYKATAVFALGNKPSHAKADFDDSVHVGPTPTKRMKLTSSSNDNSFEMDEIMKVTKISDSPAKTASPVKQEPVLSNGHCCHCEDDISALSEEQQVELAKKLSRNEMELQQPEDQKPQSQPVSANQSSTSTASTTIVPIRSELCQQEVVYAIRDTFHFVHHDPNSGIMCRHGNLWFTAPAPATAGGQPSQRKSRALPVSGLIRISSSLWNRIFKFFPEGTPYCYPDFGPCPDCEDTATSERAAIDKIREDAKLVGAQLGGLAKRTKRGKVDAALRPVHLVTSDFCNRLNDWITGKTHTMEGGKTLNNAIALCRHNRLTFAAEELAEEVSSEKGIWVATRVPEWKYIKDNFKLDTEVYLKPVVEKVGSQQKDSSSSSSSGGGSLARSGWSTNLPLSTSATGRGQSSILAACLNSKTAQQPRGNSRLSPAEEAQANTNSIVIDDSSDVGDPYGEEDGEEPFEEQMTDEEETDEDLVMENGKGRGRGARGGGSGGAKGRGRGRSKSAANGPAGEARQAKSKRVGWDTTPGMCGPCHEERQLQLAIAKSKPEPLQWSGSVFVKMDYNAESVTPPAPPRSRRGRRVAQSNRKTHALAGDEIDYVVDSTMTFVDFQCMIMEDFEISPLEQILFTSSENSDEPRQITPTDSSVTLGQLQIHENQVFHLKRKEEDEDEDCVVVPSSATSEVDENNKKSKTNNRAEGFGGTLLSVLANAAPLKRPISPGPSSNN